MTAVAPDAPKETVHASILVVDDEPDILEAIKSILEIHLPDAEVRIAESGQKALECLAEEPIHLILTDYRMPEMDGLQFLKKAKAKAPKAVRIMITAYPDLDLALRALNEEHVLNFITKPIQAERLIAVVNDALAVRKDKIAQARTVAAALDELRRRRSVADP